MDKATFKKQQSKHKEESSPMEALANPLSAPDTSAQANQVQEKVQDASRHEERQASGNPVSVQHPSAHPSKKETGFQKTAKGLLYKIIKKGKGNKPKDGQMLLVNIQSKTEDGEVLLTTEGQNSRILWYHDKEDVLIEILNLISGKVEDDLIEVLGLIQEGGSVIVKQDEHTCHDNFGRKAPVFRHIDLEAVMDKDAFEKWKAQKRQEVLTIIDAYLKKNKITALSTSSGSRYNILQAGTGEKAKYGDTVEIKCQRQLFKKGGDGQYITCNTSSNYYTIKLQSSIDKSGFGILVADIRADLQEVIVLLGQGSKAQLFIPLLDDKNPAGDNYFQKLKIEITRISSLKKDFAIIDAYLKKNKITALSTSSGLKYSILQAGTGKKPKDGDIVTLSCRRRRLLKDKDIDDQSRTPETCKIEFCKIKLGKDLKEVEEIIALLKQGSKVELFIPFSWGIELFSSWDDDHFVALLFGTKLLSMLLDNDDQARDNCIYEIEIIDILHL